MANETASQTQPTGQRGGGQRQAQADAPSREQPAAEPAQRQEQRAVASRPALGAVFDPHAGIRVGLLQLARNWAEEGHVYSAINTYKMLLMRYPDTGVAAAAVEDMLNLATALQQRGMYFAALNLFNTMEEMV